MLGQDGDIYLNASTSPEFDRWRWHEYWAPAEEVVEFKRYVYESALTELSRLIVGLESMGEYRGRMLEERQNGLHLAQN